MNENVENLVLEHSRAIRGDMSRLNDRMDTFHAEMTAMRQMLRSVLTVQDHDHGDISAIKVRLDRIERRLDLVE